MLFDSPVMAGFPSPAADHAQKRIDLIDHLLLHREASFLFRVSGNSMIGVGIFDGDTIIVDRSIDAKHTRGVSGTAQDFPVIAACRVFQAANSDGRSPYRATLPCSISSRVSSRE